MKNETINKNQKRINKLCLISLIVSGIITVLFMIFAVAPFLTAAVGIFMYLILGISAGIISFASLGMVWIDEGFKNKWIQAFDFAKKIMNDGSIIANGIGKNVIWISIIIFLLSSFGFISNIIAYKKYKNNKVKLILSIVFISISLIALTVSNIIYLTYKNNPIG